MKVLAIADALLPAPYVENGLAELKSRGADITILTWGEADQEAIDKRAINLELYGPTAEEPPSEVDQYIGATEILMVHYCPVSQALLEKASKLQILGTFRAGMENIDVQAATDLRIPTFHVVGRTTEAVSDFTIGLLLAETRNIARADAALKKGLWLKEFSNSATTPEFESKSMGIVGFGEIGRAVMRKLKGFCMKFYVYDPYVPVEAITTMGGEAVDLDTLLKYSDFISLHVRMEKGQEPLIGEREFGLMKPTSYLINTARAYAIDQDALCRALEDQRISGAALDTFNPEPLPPDHPLLKLENVTLTPHLASSTLECMAKSPRLLTGEIVKFMDTGSSRFLVNPEILQDQWQTN